MWYNDIWYVWLCDGVDMKQEDIDLDDSKNYESIRPRL